MKKNKVNTFYGCEFHHFCQDKCVCNIYMTELDE